MQEFWEKGLLHPLSVLAQQVLVVLPNVLAMSIIFAAGSRIIGCRTVSKPVRSWKA